MEKQAPVDKTACGVDLCNIDSETTDSDCDGSVDESTSVQ